MRWNTMKRGTALFLSAAMTLGLCACTSSPSSEAASETETAEAASSTEQTDGEEITLTFWEMNYGSDDSYLETCEKLIAQYESENPGVNVEITLQPWDNYYQLFLTAVTSNAAPDVASVALDMPDMYARMGEALALDDVIDAWEADGTISDYNEATLKSFTYEDQQIAVPYMVGYRGILYRADYLEECGIEKVPETWDELLDACEKIKQTRPDLVPLDFAGGEPGSWHYFICFAMSNDAGILNTDGTPASTSEAYKQTIDLFKTFKEKGYVADGVLGHKSADAEKLYYPDAGHGRFATDPASAQPFFGDQGDFYQRIRGFCLRPAGDPTGCHWLCDQTDRPGGTAAPGPVCHAGDPARRPPGAGAGIAPKPAGIPRTANAGCAATDGAYAGRSLFKKSVRAVELFRRPCEPAFQGADRIQFQRPFVGMPHEAGQGAALP